MSQQNVAPQPQPPQNQPPTPKKANPLLPGGWVALVVLAVLAILYFTSTTYREIEYSQFIDLVNTGQVKKVVLIGNDRAEGEVRDPNTDRAKELKLRNGKFGVNLPHTQDQPSLIREWETQDQKHRPNDPTDKMTISKREDPSWVGPFILNLLLIGVLIAILVFFFLPRIRDPMGGGFLNSYTRSPAKRSERGKGRFTFDDVAGMENAQRELPQIVQYPREPAKFTRLGTRAEGRAALRTARHRQDAHGEGRGG